MRAHRAYSHSADRKSEKVLGKLVKRIEYRADSSIFSLDYLAREYDESVKSAKNRAAFSLLCQRLRLVFEFFLRSDKSLNH